MGIPSLIHMIGACSQTSLTDLGTELNLINQYFTYVIVINLIQLAFSLNRSPKGRFTQSNFDPIIISIFLCMMKNVGIHTIQFSHPIIS